MIDKLKHIFGPQCTAIHINGEINEFINIPSKQMKFCEAVSFSFNVPIRLNSKNLNCAGARRIVGFDNNDKELTKNIAVNNHLPEKFVRDTVNKILKLKDVKHINLGLTEYMEKDLQPDLYILYVQPAIITDIMHVLAQKAIQPSIPPYSLMSVCGNVFANCYINRSVSISFGCPESRKHGGIEKNEVVMGIPYKIAFNLIRNYEG